MPDSHIGKKGYRRQGAEGSLLNVKGTGLSVPCLEIMIERQKNLEAYRTIIAIQIAMVSIPYFRYPVTGIGEGVSYDLGSLKHTGPDLYAIDFSYIYQGIDVYPTIPGRAVWVGYERNYGWTVVIRHWDDSKWDKKYYSIYAHLTGSGLPKLWDVVDGTKPIGKMGKSGNGANGTVHLHFAVRSSSKVYDGVTALYGKDGINLVAFNVPTLGREGTGAKRIIAIRGLSYIMSL